MKQIRKYTIVFILFIITMISVIVYFYFRFKRIEVLNTSKELLSDLYSLNSGDYVFKDGYVYKDNKKLNNKYYLNGNGLINIDKYKNIKFYINYNDKCIYKSSLGNTKLLNKNCSGFDTVDVIYNKNNSIISFTSNKSNLEYKVSRKDDFKGIWIKEEYSDNLILKYYSDGDNYIWFKDIDGNISEVIKFNIGCLNTNKAKYDSGVFYCTGSTVILDDLDWIVVEDTNRSIKLMKQKALDDKLYQNLDNITHKWSSSYINYYLNNDFINKLSTSTQNKLLEYKICDDDNNYSCSNESCNGHLEEDIIINNWKCDNYTKSKIKIISYDEFNTLYSKSNNTKILNGNYWAINSYVYGKGSSIQDNGEIYIMEELSKLLDVKPVITLKK